MRYRELSTLTVFVLMTLSAGLVANGHPVKRIPIEGKSFEEIAALVIGHNEPFWEVQGEIWIGQTGVVSKHVNVAYRPFRSSSRLCRTFVTTIDSPGWGHDDDAWSGYVVGLDVYEVETLVLLAELPEAGDVSCVDLDLNRDYFVLRPALRDAEVILLIDSFNAHLDAWKNSVREDPEWVGLENISSKDIVEIEILPGEDVPLVRVKLKPPMSNDSMLGFQFRWRLNGGETDGQEMYLLLQ